jgi:hypothetical protein
LFVDAKIRMVVDPSEEGSDTHHPEDAEPEWMRVRRAAHFLNE